MDIKCEHDSEVIICFEGRIMDSSTEIIIDNGKFSENYGTYMYRQLLGDDIKKELSNYTLKTTDTGYRVSANREHIGWTDNKKPFKLALRINLKSWIEEGNPFYSLGRWAYSAGQFGFVRAE